jgi:integrase
MARPDLHPDRKRLQKYFSTQREATEWLLEQRNNIGKGILDNTTLTIDQLLDLWIELKQSTVSTKTYNSYLYLVKNHIRPALGKFKLKDLRPAHLQSLYKVKLESGLSTRSVRYIHTLIHNCLDTAIKWEMTSRNVAKQVQPPALKRRKATVLNREQTKIFLEKGVTSRWYPVYVLALMTGMREGEILGLRWTDVDLNKMILSVEQVAQYLPGQGIVHHEPKTELSRRAVKLPRFVVDILRKHKEQQDVWRKVSVWEEHGLVFTTYVGTSISTRNLLRDFQDLLAELGLPKIRIHDLRHTHATLLLMGNIHPKIVQERLGHSKINMTLDTYSHVIPEMQQPAADEMDDLFGDELMLE